MPSDVPDNLRKFLESDDPAMISMGLSMAKGSADTSRLTLGQILGLYMFHGNKEIRSLAKTAFTKLAPSVPKGIVRKYWQAEYRTQSWVWDGWMQKMVLDIEDTGINTTYLLARGLISPTEEVDDVRSSILDMLGKRDLSESHITVRSFLKNLTSISRWGYKHQGNVEAASKILKELDL